MTPTEIQKQIKKIRADLLKLRQMSAEYPNWNNRGWITDSGRYADQMMNQVADACNGLDMVLI